jgi:signal transduction histidine kinase
MTRSSSPNTGKYAAASMARVSLSFPDNSVLLVIEDDGVGFEVEQVEGPTRYGGLGLYGMRERATLSARRSVHRERDGTGNAGYARCSAFIDCP